MAGLHTHNRRRTRRRFKDQTPDHLQVVPETPKVEDVLDFIDWGPVGDRFDFAAWHTSMEKLIAQAFGVDHAVLYESPPCAGHSIPLKENTEC